MAKTNQGLGYICVVACCCLIGFPIWVGIYFGIYYPLLNRDWTDSICIVTGIEQYQIGWTINDLYTEFKLGVLVKGQIQPGYACECVENRSSISNGYPEGTYPYKEVECQQTNVQWGTCKQGQIFFPRWMCSGYHGYGQYVIGDSVECMYHINGDGSEYTYPSTGGTYIEVLFDKEAYIPQADYIALWVIPFGIMSVLSCLCICLVLFPVGIGCCDSSERQKCEFCLAHYLKCDWHLRPHSLEHLQLDKYKPPSVIVWIFTYSKEKTVFTFNRNIAREVGGYLE